MILTPDGGDATPTCPVTAAALQAYSTVCPLFANPTLTYEQARAHASGDGLADFLVIELTEGAEGGPLASRFERGAKQVDFAIASLQHVAAQLRTRALSASSLPLPLTSAEAGEPLLAGAAAAAW